MTVYNTTLKIEQCVEANALFSHYECEDETWME
jgi:hypothetical protein